MSINKYLRTKGNSKKKVLKLTKGHVRKRKNISTASKDADEKVTEYTYSGRNRQKRAFSSLWIQRINAGARVHGLSYSQLMELLKKNDINIERKVLADLASNHPEAFSEIVQKVHPTKQFKKSSIAQNKISLECEIYLDTENIDVAEEYYKAVREVANIIGFEISKQNKAIIGSWFKRFWIKSKKVIESREVQERLEKLERGLELKNIDKVQSEVDLNTAQAIGILMEKSQGIPRLVTKVGSLLFVKITVNGEESIFADNLTQKQLKFLKQNPSLTKRPEDLLKKLEEMEASEFSPKRRLQV
jgi:large subunit ribosomal protein L20